MENSGELVHEARAVPGSALRYVHTVGKLVLIRIGRIATVADMASVHFDIVRALSRATSSGDSSCVVCSDCRAAAPFPPDVVDAWSRCMREVNDRIDRDALLVDSDSAMFSLQAARAVRCAGKSERHVFTDPEATLRFLDDPLADFERAELRRFLVHGTL